MMRDADLAKMIEDGTGFPHTGTNVMFFNGYPGDDFARVFVAQQSSADLSLIVFEKGPVKIKVRNNRKLGLVGCQMELSAERPAPEHRRVKSENYFEVLEGEERDIIRHIKEVLMLWKLGEEKKYPKRSKRQ